MRVVRFEHYFIIFLNWFAWWFWVIKHKISFSFQIDLMQKDLRNIFLRCIQRAPSIIVFENLDSLVKATSDQVQSGEYYGHVSDMIRHFISMYTNQFCISVIATVSDMNTLNHRLYNVRGNILFGKIYRISSLSRVIIMMNPASPAKR